MVSDRKDIEAAKIARTTTTVVADRDAIEHDELHVKAAVGPDKHGFRRAGIYFPRNEKVVIPADTLNAERLAAIRDEQMLNVVEVPTSAPKTAKKKDDDKK